MATVLESITKKIEELEAGQVRDYLGNETLNNSIVELLDPREYKEFFRLDDLGINKSLKACAIEVKNSECKLYYLLDSALINTTLSCKFQPIEVTKELPLATIDFLRVLSAKKAPIELNIFIDKLHIIFEDTIPRPIKNIDIEETDNPTPKKRQKKEKPVAKKYILELPLRDLQELDKTILEFVEKIDVNSAEDTEPFNIPISLKHNSQDSFYRILHATYGYYDDYGNFNYSVISCNKNLTIDIIEFPIIVGNSFIEERVVESNDYSEEEEEEEEEVDELLKLSEPVDNILEEED